LGDASLSADRSSFDEPAFRRPRIAIRDEVSGEFVDLTPEQALDLLRRDPEVRHLYLKHTKTTGQWYAPPQSRGRLLLIGGPGSWRGIYDTGGNPQAGT
jgi:hypothetical protein